MAEPEESAKTDEKQEPPTPPGTMTSDESSEDDDFEKESIGSRHKERRSSQGVRMPVTKARYRTMDALLDELNDHVPLSFGVRRLVTPLGRTPVKSVEQLKHGGKYICTSSKWARRIDLETVERLRRQLDVNKRSQSHYDPLQLSHSARNEKDSTLLHSLTSSATPPNMISGGAKQILFILNGQPNKTYRTNLKANRLPTFDGLLEEVSENMLVKIHKFYSMDGNRIESVADILTGEYPRLLACRRNERPFLPSTNGMRTNLPVIASNSANGSSNRGRSADVLMERSSSTGIVMLPRLPASKAAVHFREKGGTFIPYENGKRVVRHRKNEDTDTNSIERPLRKAPKRLPLTAKNQHAVKRVADVDKAGENVVKELGKRSSKKKRKQNVAGSGKSAPVFSDREQESVVKIQAGIRGFLARKDMKRESSAARMIQKNFRGYLHRAGAAGKFPESDEEKAMRAVRAATAIQSAFRGYRVRKEVRSRLPSRATEIIANQRQGQQRVGTSEEKVDDATLPTLMEDQESDTMFYTVSMFVGNRWSADTRADLYIVLHGENDSSEKHWLRQDNERPKFCQNEVDHFDIESKNHGALKKLTVGHERPEYGAGVFIDRVMVTENRADGRQFFFFCNRWLDGGQVDGKIERNLNCAGFCIAKRWNGSEDDDDALSEGQEALSKGRIELTLHTGSVKTQAECPNLLVTAFGSVGCSEALPLEENDLGYDQATYELDFGPIGEIYKLRFESDGRNANANQSSEPISILLKSVDFCDLDTGEEACLYCNQKIGWPILNVENAADKEKTSKKSSLQPFRELPLMRPNVDPLDEILRQEGCILILVCVYDGKVTLSTDSMFRMKASYLFMQIIGEFGESGRFPVFAKERKSGGKENKTKDMTFAVETVNLGRVRRVRVEVPNDNAGAALSEACASLQTIYDKLNISDVPSKREWAVNRCVVRESSHAPYQFILAESRVVNSKDGTSEDTISQDLALTEMEGLSTRISKKKQKPRQAPNWKTYLNIGEAMSGKLKSIPYLTLYGENGTSNAIKLYKEEFENGFPPESVAEFDLQTPTLGALYKVRLFVEPSPAAADATGEEEETVGTCYVKQLRLVDTVNGEEVHLSPETWCDRELTREFPVIWPDVPPMAAVTYHVTVYTGAESSAETDFAVVLNVFGKKGDTGRRVLRNSSAAAPESIFKPGNADSFDLHAVSVDEIHHIEVGITDGTGSSKWFLDRIKLVDYSAGKNYLFEHKSWFSSAVDAGGSKDRHVTVKPTHVTTIEENNNNNQV